MNAHHSNNNKHKPQNKSHRANSSTKHSEDSIEAENSHQRTQEPSATPPINVVVHIPEDMPLQWYFICFGLVIPMSLIVLVKKVFHILKYKRHSLSFLFR